MRSYLPVSLKGEMDQSLKNKKHCTIANGEDSLNLVIDRNVVILFQCLWAWKHLWCDSKYWNLHKKNWFKKSSLCRMSSCFCCKLFFFYVFLINFCFSQNKTLSNSPFLPNLLNQCSCCRHWWVSDQENSQPNPVSIAQKCHSHTDELGMIKLMSRNISGNWQSNIHSWKRFSWRTLYKK